jgi:hypothetical protein
MQIHLYERVPWNQKETKNKCICQVPAHAVKAYRGAVV